MSIRRTASVLCVASLFAARASDQTPAVDPAAKPDVPATSSSVPTASDSTPTNASDALKMPRFKDLFNPIGDMKRMVQQPGNLAVLGIGAATTMAARPFDAQGARAYW